MPRLIVKNFGPIKDIDIELKNYNVFIGPSATGKSAVAKLVDLFRKPHHLAEIKTNEQLEKKLAENGLGGYWVNGKSYVEYVEGGYSAKLVDDKVEATFDLREFSMRPFYLAVLDDLQNALLGDLGPLRMRMRRIQQLRDSGAIHAESRMFKFWEALSDAIESGKDLVNLEDWLLKLKEVDALSPMGAWRKIPLFFPEDRASTTMLDRASFSLSRDDVPIPEKLRHFLPLFEFARQEYGTIYVSALKISYEFQNGRNLVKQGKKTFELQNTASGFQSAIPLVVVLRHSATGSFTNIIEEPELNLYPSAQRGLMATIIEHTKAGGSDLVITTHSPYIISAFDNHIQAHNAFRVQPAMKDEIAKIIPESQWIDFDQVSAYYFDKGKCRSILDKKIRAIGTSNIDVVSEDIANEFSALLNFKYP